MPFINHILSLKEDILFYRFDHFVLDIQFKQMIIKKIQTLYFIFKYFKFP